MTCFPPQALWMTKGGCSMSSAFTLSFLAPQDVLVTDSRGMYTSRPFSSQIRIGNSPIVSKLSDGDHFH